MLVTKCDICKKEVKDKDQIVLAGVGGHFSTQAFCLKCGKPVADFLNKLNKTNKNGKRKK